MGLIHLNQIQDGMFLKEAVENINSSQTVTYQLTGVIDKQAQFDIPDSPLSEPKLVMFINGVQYIEDKYLTVNRDTKKLTWDFTEVEGGFDLLGEFDIQIQYNRVKPTGDAPPVVVPPVEPEPEPGPEPEPTGVWEIPFIIEPGEHKVDIRTLPDYDESKVITIQDFYGDEFDGVNPRVVVQFFKRSTNSKDTWDDVSLDSPQVVPLSFQSEIPTPNSGQGRVEYDTETFILKFAAGDVPRYFYKLVKLS